MPLHAALAGHPVRFDLVLAGRAATIDSSESHANTMLVGPGGLEPREDLWIGATLMAPNTDYPVHHHPPEEIYLVLSAGDWWRDGTGWFTPGVGGTLYNAGHSPCYAFAAASRSSPSGRFLSKNSAHFGNRDGGT